MENPEFIRAVAGAGRPVFFATGGVPEAALGEALDLAGECPVGLLHGYQTFPTPIEEIRYLDFNAATLQFGTGHSGGIILVLTKR